MYIGLVAVDTVVEHAAAGKQLVEPRHGGLWNSNDDSDEEKRICIALQGPISGYGAPVASGQDCLKHRRNRG